MKKRATKALALVLALLMVVMSVAAVAMVPPIKGKPGMGFKGNQWCKPIKPIKPFIPCKPWKPWKPCVKKDPFPSNNMGMLVLRKVATDPADVGKAFYFTYTVNGGKPVSVVLAAGSSSATAYKYQQSMPLDSTIVVSEILPLGASSTYDTTINGSPGLTVTVKLTGPQTLVEFVNSRVVIDEEAADGQG